MRRSNAIDGPYLECLEHNQAGGDRVGRRDRVHNVAGHTLEREPRHDRDVVLELGAGAGARRDER